MDTGGDRERDARSDRRDFLPGAVLAPDFALPFDKKPDLFDRAMRDSERHLTWREGTVNRTRSFSRGEAADLRLIRSQTVVVLG